MKHLWAILAGCCLLVVGTACDNGNTAPKSMEALHKENGVPIQVQVISQGSGKSDLSWHTVLVGGRESVAKSFIDDRVDEIRYRVGDQVEKNTVVMTFPTDNPAAKYHQAKVAFEHSTTTLERMKKLYESGGISLQELDNVRTQHRVMQADWKAAQEAIQVEAPISGVITQIAVRESDNVKPGTELFTVADTRTLRAKLLVTESLIGQVNAGDKAEAEYRGKVLSGKVVQVDRSMNSKQQAYGVMIDFDNPGKALASGVNAEVRILTEHKGNGIFVARKDVQRDNDERFVYVVEGGVAKKRSVQVGASIGTQLEILSGLKAGDKLVTATQMLLKDGTKVRIIES